MTTKGGRLVGVGVGDGIGGCVTTNSVPVLGVVGDSRRSGRGPGSGVGIGVGRPGVGLGALGVGLRVGLLVGRLVGLLVGLPKNCYDQACGVGVQMIEGLVSSCRCLHTETRKQKQLTPFFVLAIIIIITIGSAPGFTRGNTRTSSNTIIRSATATIRRAEAAYVNRSCCCGRNPLQHSLNPPKSPCFSSRRNSRTACDIFPINDSSSTGGGVLRKKRQNEEQGQCGNRQSKSSPNNGGHFFHIFRPELVELILLAIGPWLVKLRSQDE